MVCEIVTKKVEAIELRGYKMRVFVVSVHYN
jgi:hypothetical protein